MSTRPSAGSVRILVSPDAYVIDTSVIARWFLLQSGWQHAQQFRDQFLAGKIQLHTVECARFELPHVLRTKGLLQGKMNETQYRAAVRVIDDFDIRVEPMTADALEECAVLAIRHNLRFFDAVFLQRAISADLALLTADQPLATVAEQAGVLVAVVRAT